MGLGTASDLRDKGGVGLWVNIRGISSIIQVPSDDRVKRGNIAGFPIITRGIELEPSVLREGSLTARVLPQSTLASRGVDRNEYLLTMVLSNIGTTHCSKKLTGNVEHWDERTFSFTMSKVEVDVRFRDIESAEEGSGTSKISRLGCVSADLPKARRHALCKPRRAQQ